MFMPSLALALCLESVAKDYSISSAAQGCHAAAPLPHPLPQLPAWLSLSGSDLQSSFGVNSFGSYSFQHRAAQPTTTAINLTAKAL